MNSSEARIFDKDDLSGKEQTFMPDNATIAIANRIAEAVANIKLDISEQRFALPNMLTFLEMFGVSKIEHLNPLTRWKENNHPSPFKHQLYGHIWRTIHAGFAREFSRSARTCRGYYRVRQIGIHHDLHPFLASNFHPNEVSFLLIDYKAEVWQEL